MIYKLCLKTDVQMPRPPYADSRSYFLLVGTDKHAFPGLFSVIVKTNNDAITNMHNGVQR